MNAHTKHSVKRQAAEVFGALAFGALVLFGIFFWIGQQASNSGDLFAPGPPPSREARQEVERANCKKLIELTYRYTPEGDSVDPEVTLLGLTRERLADLHCPIPPDLRPISH
jgi:hypothetical protein